MHLSSLLIVTFNIMSFRSCFSLFRSSRGRNVAFLSMIPRQKTSGGGYGHGKAMCTAAVLLASLSSTSTSTTLNEAAEPEDKFKETAMYPKIDAYEKGALKVSDIHTIAYSLYGNPKGKPVLFVHGGPGGGTNPAMARYFDPVAYHIILVDQRGCGDSEPFAVLDENSTYDSVKDFEKIRTLLKIDKWQVFGGSWGSTLALAYAMEHPTRVTELVLRGIFLLRQKEINWLYQGPGANYLFPEDWSMYEEAIPVSERGDYMKAYGRRLRGELGEEEMKKAAKAWSIWEGTCRDAQNMMPFTSLLSKILTPHLLPCTLPASSFSWEGRTSNLVQAPWETIKDRFGAHKFSLAFARIENHFFTNYGWFPRDGFLLEKQQIDKIRNIPTVIVQGRYDVVCPAISAYDLKQAFPEAELIMTLAGHSGFEKENIAQLVKATDKYKHV